MESAAARALATPPLPTTGSPPPPASLRPSLSAPRPVQTRTAAAKLPPQRPALAQRGSSSTADAHDAPPAGVSRSGSECPSDLSLNEALGSAHGRDDGTTNSDATDRTIDAFPAILFPSSPSLPPSTWRGVVGPTLGGSSTQPHGASPNGGRGPLRATHSTRTAPPPPHHTLSDAHTPPASSSLVSLQNQTGTRSSSGSSTPREDPHRHSSHAAAAAAASQQHQPRPTSLTMWTKKELRRRHPQHRLDSAQARRVVVEKQRHRKLFELSSGVAAGGESAGRGAESDGDARLRCDSAAEASAGWMAALAAPPVPDTGPLGLLDGELLSVSAAASKSAVSSPRFGRSGNAGSPSCRDTPHHNSKSGSTGSPQHTLSSTRRLRSPPSNRTGLNGSFGTAASLTSLQHRLWQHTTTAVMRGLPAHREMEEGGRRLLPRLAQTLPPSPPLARPPGAAGQQQQQQQRVAAMTAMRRGQYAACIPPTPLTASMDAAADNGSHPLLSRALTYPPPTAAVATTAGGACSAVPVDVTQWESSLRVERRCGHEGKRIAQWLVQTLLSSSPLAAVERSRYASLKALCGGGLDDGSDVDDDDAGDDDSADDAEGGGLLRSLSERAAVATYLLSTLVDESLPRHQQSVLPYVRMLIEFACVPDTPVIRAALGQGTVQDEELLDRLAKCDRCLLPFTGTATLPPSSRPHALDPRLAGGEEETAVDLLGLLAPTFTRQTYITAHFALAGRTIGLAHEVRCRELHQRNVPRLLERTHKNWMRGLMRAVLRAWHFLCQERRVQEQRQRARWALRWTNERMRISLRRWRGYAAITLHMAEADNVAKTALAQKRGFIERLDREAAAMQRLSRELQATLQRQDEERERVEAAITQREILYQRLLQQVREVDRVGSLMLNSLLLAKAPPRFADISAISGLGSPLVSRQVSRRGSFASSVVGDDDEASDADSAAEETEDDEDDEPQPPHAVTALPVLLQWATDCSSDAERDFLALYPEEPAVATERESGSGGKERSQRASLSDSSVAPYVPATFASLLQRTTGEVGEYDAALGETVLLPLHKLLLLMRGCSGVESASEGLEGGTATAAMASSTAAGAPLSSQPAAATSTQNGEAATSLDALTAALADAAAGEAHDGMADASGAPSLRIIRTVQLADAVVVMAARAVLEREDGTGEHSSPLANARSTALSNAAAGVLPEENSAEASLQASGSSLLLRLPREKRETLQRVCRVVIDAYEQLTGTACVVTAEQLQERSRGALLVFLAALMRHYTNWMVRRAQQALLTTNSATTAEAVAASSSLTSDTSLAPVPAAPAEAAKVSRRGNNSEGVPHRRYDEWSHPPHSHRRWLGQVRRQAEWIALSFSALHDAMRVANLSSSVLTVVQQDHVSGLLGRLSLTEFIDLLPNQPDQTMQCYVDMIGAVERYAPSLHLLFHEFALPLAKLRADGAVHILAAKAKQSSQRRSLRGELGQSSEQPDKALYITANTVWHLLCLTGLAGQRKEAYCTTVSRQHRLESSRRGSEGEEAATSAAGLVTPPFSATLHRPAVFSLIEQVTQNGVASTALSRRRSSTWQPGSDGSPTKGAYADTAAAAESAAPTATTLAFTASCKTRPRPCYARALREGRHVDLRQDTGAVCVNYTQFVKVVIRLAHAWQCMQQQQEAEEQQQEQCWVTVEENAEGVKREEKTTAGAEQTGRGMVDGGSNSSATNNRQGTTPSPLAASKGTHLTTAEAGTERRLSLSTTPAPASSTRVAYEVGNYAHTLSLPYFHAFLGELFLPRLLGSTRWSSAAQRATCSRPVLQLLAQHHDELLEVFNNYQQPREARGVRGSLPPPYSTVLASQLFARVVDAERQSSTALTVGGGRSMSHAQRASLMYGLSSSMIRRSSTAALMGGDEFNDSATNRGGIGRNNQQPGRRASLTRGKQNSLGGSRLNAEDAAIGDNLRASIATAQRTDISIVSVLQWADVMTLAKEMRWLTIRRVSEATLRRCFDHVRADVAREGDAVFFAEYLQLLCAVAAYATPSPAVSLEVKLKFFLETYVLTMSD